MSTPQPPHATRPTSHLEVAVGSLWRVVVGEVGGLARRLLGPDLLPPLLERLRSGVGLVERVTDLLEHALRTTVDPEAINDDGPTPSPARQADEEAIRAALAEGIEHARDSGEVAPSRSTDAVAWAITSLLMTLLMRSREGEDVESLMAAGTSAIHDLLLPAGRLRGGSGAG